MASVWKWSALAFTAALVVACGGGGGDGGSATATTTPPPSSGGSCTEAREKQFVEQAARDWYLFLELLPASIDQNAYPTADDLLDGLTATARAQNKDRFFSYLTTITAEQQFFAQGQSVGFGISTVIRDNNTRLFVTQVYEDSAAAQAGFARGDEIVAIGANASTLVAVSQLLAQPNGLNDALGPAQTGVSRVFRVRTLAGATVERSVAKRDFSLNPVPEPTAGSTRLIQRPGTSPIGYVNLRTFISPADQRLRDVFAAFAAANVRDLIVDLRYNGGGAVATAELLSNLMLGGQDKVGQVLFQTKLNARHTSNEETVRIRAEAQAVPALRIAFLTLGGSASASELVIASLAPYAEVAVVGARTYGKPVGQFAFDLNGCDTRLRLVTFKSVNRDNYGDYFNGLPDTAAQVPDAFCAAPDDLTRGQGDAAEAMTGTAIAWLNNGACPAATALREKSLADMASSFPTPPRRPAPIQVVQPGAY